MNIAPFSADAILSLLPVIGTFLLAAVILLLDMIVRPSQRVILGWLSAAGAAGILIAHLILNQPAESSTLLLGGMVRVDWLSYTFTTFILFAAAVTSLISIGISGVGDRGEFYALMLVASMGMVLMASAADLIMVYLAIETTSIPLYILAGFLRSDDKSTESGIKYFLFGALTSTVMLYGFSLLFGLSGTTNLYQIPAALAASQISPFLLGGVVLLILVGFGFKVAAVPFHFWTPDVYEGAPTSITAYISTASKAAGFAVLVRVMLVSFPAVEGYWTGLVAAMAVGTMTLGNLLALAQTNIKRLLAYSSIAHAGYALIGLVALSQFGTASLMFYLLAYIVTNLAAFTVVILFARSAGSEEIADYAGLSRRSPGMALVLLVALLSLAGMPPLVGFVAKVYVFAAAVESGLIWLAFVGVLNAIIGLYYYLTVLKVVYLYRSDDEDQPISISTPYALSLGACVVGILGIGVLSGPWLEWVLRSAKGIF